MIRAPIGFALLFACGARGPTYVTDVNPSPLNGVWLEPDDADAGRPIGIIVFDLPTGPAWSPHGLVVAGESSLYITHDCRDFQVDAQATVRPVAGIKPLGTVVYSSASAQLTWDVGAANWRGLLASSLPSRPFSRYADTFDSGVVLIDAGTIDFRFRLLRTFYTLDGGTYESYFPDGGLMPNPAGLESNLTLTRSTTCR